MTKSVVDTSKALPTIAAVVLLAMSPSPALATKYKCQLDSQNRSEFQIYINGESATLTREGLTQHCLLTRNSEILKEANENLKSNFDIDFDAQEIVVCDSPALAEQMVYLISRTTFMNSRYNALVSSPTVGPVGRAACRRQS